MKSEWNIKPLAECIELIIDYRGKTPKKLGGDWSETGYRALSAKNVKTSGLVQEDIIRRIDETIYKKWMKEEVKRGDILLTSEAPLGEVLLWDSDEKIVLSQRLFAIRPNQNLDSAYMYYYMSAKKYQHELESRSTGTTVVGIKQTQLVHTLIKYPPFQTQKKIAHILSTLDDKIELNRKMNQTLEEMAQALFKSWFVDFDPVHAKVQAKSEQELEVAASKLGISKEILDLFPSEFEESEMGMIPLGWSRDVLGSFVEILDSKRVPISKNERAKIQGSIPYYGATSIMDYVDDYLFDEPLTLMGEDGSVVREDGTPFMQYIWGKAWINNHAHVIKSKSTLSTEAIYIALLKQNVTMFVTGAVQPKINQTNLKKIPIVKPSNNLHNVYSDLIAPMFSKRRQLINEIDTLQKTRDTLLPKLLSGELDVSEIKI